MFYGEELQSIFCQPCVAPFREQDQYAVSLSPRNV